MMSGCLSFSLCSREYFCVPCDLALELWKLVDLGSLEDTLYDCTVMYCDDNTAGYVHYMHVLVCSCISCISCARTYTRKQKYLVHLVYPAVGETRDFERAPTGEAPAALLGEGHSRLDSSSVGKY